MRSVGFEPAIPASEPPQTHALDRADTGMGYCPIVLLHRINFLVFFVDHLPVFYELESTFLKAVWRNVCLKRGNLV
jgi:hypothetical protein